MRILTARWRIVLGAFILLLAAQAAVAQAQWIYLARGADFAVVDPESGDQVGGGSLRSASFPENPATPEIVPTPGGRYVFFHFRHEDAAVVVDAETHEVVRTLELPEASERIQFSSMGDSLYVETTSGRFEFAHRRGDISGGPSAAPDLAAGRIAFNRRATRIYGERDGELVYALARDGSEVTSVRLRGGPYDWQVSPNFRYLLGTSRDGEGMVLVDEARARVVGYIPASFIVGSARFEETSREVLFLGADGGQLVAVDVRRARVSSRTELETDLAGVWQDDEGTLYGLTENARELVLEVAGEARRVSVVSLIPGSGRLAAELVSLKPGQGFACF